jgi:mono/diheme cytochrome c family protein
MFAFRFVEMLRDRRWTGRILALTSGFVLVWLANRLGAQESARAARSIPTSSASVAPAARKASLCDLYKRNCQRCHDQDGRGSRAREHMRVIPDFTSKNWHEERSDADLIVSIQEGKGNSMPAFPDKFTEEQLRELVAQVRSFVPQRAKASTPLADKEFERRYRALQEELRNLREQFRELARQQENEGDM